MLNLKHQGKSMWFWRANQTMDWYRHNSAETYQHQRQEQRSSWSGPALVSAKHQRYTGPQDQGGKGKDNDAWSTWKPQQHHKGWNWKGNQ